MRSRGFQGAVLKALRVPEHRLVVTAVRDRSPYTELTVTCPTLLGSGGPHLPPTAWLRMWFPEGDREYQRAYTVTAVDREAATARILVLRHDPAGPGSRWVQRAAPGDVVAAQLMGGAGYTGPEAHDRALFVGDLASAPALAEAVAAAPDGCQVRAVLVCDCESFPLQVDAPLALVAPDESVGLFTAVEAAARTIGTPTWGWVSLESGLTRVVRRRLLELGAPRRAVQHQAYWVRGRAMGVSQPAEVA